MQIATTTKIIYPELSYKITGILFETHNRLGRHCNEQQYADSVQKFLEESGIKYSRELILPPSFEGEIPGRNKLDFLIEDKLILELKAKRIINREDYYQMRRYLDALNLKLGILVNFRDEYIKPKRILNSAGKI